MTNGERGKQSELGQNARYTLEEGAFLFNALSGTMPGTGPAPLGAEIRRVLAASPLAEGPEDYWGFDRHQLLLKLDRLSPPEQQALRDAVASGTRPPAGHDLARVHGILDTWVNARADHRQREYLRGFLHAIGLPLQS